MSPFDLILAITLTLTFQDQIWTLLNFSQKWSDCHETKSKQTYWLNSWPQMWSRTLTLAMNLTFSLWPWPCIFKVKYGICYISAKNGPIAKKQTANISVQLLASNVTIRFNLGHDLDLEFSRSNMDFAISQSEMIWLPQNEKQTYQLNSRPEIWPIGLTLAMTLILNFQGQTRNLLV